MTFDELELFKAIKEVRAEVDGPRSSDWLIRPEFREALCRAVEARIPLKEDRIVQILQTWETCGKMSLDARDKLEIKIKLASLSGARCFWAGRVPEPCSLDVDLDRLIPGAEDGVYEFSNCVLSCSKHNQQRGKKSVEEYLRG